MKRENSYLIIDDLKRKRRKVYGAYTNGWYSDGIDDYMFKTNLSELERYKELYYSLIIRKLDLQSSEIDLAKRNNVLGIISKNYNPNHNEAFTIEEILPDNQKYNLRDLPNEISKFCIHKNWNYSMETIKHSLLIQFIIQILLGNWDLVSRNIEIQYDKEKNELLFSPFYDFTFYGNIELNNPLSCYSFRDRWYNHPVDLDPMKTLENFFNRAETYELEELKKYLEKFKNINLVKNIYEMEELTEREIAVEIKNQLIDNTEKCFLDAEGYIRELI